MDGLIDLMSLLPGPLFLTILVSHPSDENSLFKIVGATTFLRLGVVEVVKVVVVVVVVVV